MQADVATQPEARCSSGVGLRHACGRRQHLLLGRAHIGSAAQGVSGDGQRQRPGGTWHRGGCGQQLGQGGRRLAGQHGQCVAGLPDRRLQQRQLRGGLLGGSARLLGIEHAGHAGLGAPLVDLPGLLLAREVVLGDRELGLCAAQREVGQADLGGDRHLDFGQAGSAGARRGLADSQRAVPGAKQIEFPACVQACREAIASAGAALAGGLQVSTQARRGDIAQGQCLAQRVQRSLDAVVGLQGAGDQVREHRVVEPGPPLRLQASARDLIRRCRPGRRQCHGCCFDHLKR